MKNFWKEDRKGNPTVSKSLILQFLEHHGFRNAKINNQWHIVRINSHVVDFIKDTIEIRQYLINHIQECNDSISKEMLLNQTLTLFKDIKRTGLIDALKEEELNLIEGDENTTYKFFRNCAVKITTEKVDVLEYSELTGNVFRNSIIDKDFHIQEENEVWNSNFSNFLFRCMKLDEYNFQAIISVLGYLSCSYKSKKEFKAVVFCDDNKEDIPEGGTGKSLTALALGYFNKSVTEDGKNFKFSNFTFQQVEYGTQLLIIDDASKKLNFESLFSSITNGFQIEKKYHDKYSLPFKESPKILITTNYTIFGRGFSFERRVVEVEFSNYYGRKRSPLDEFRSEFFDSWNEKEWSLFFDFMIRCVMFYLGQGIKSQNISDPVLKRLRRETSFDFVEFTSDFEFKGWVKKSDLYETFLQEYSNQRNWLTQRKFNDWVRNYLLTMKINHQETKKEGGQRYWNIIL